MLLKYQKKKGELAAKGAYLNRNEIEMRWEERVVIKKESFTGLFQLNEKRKYSIMGKAINMGQSLRLNRVERNTYVNGFNPEIISEGRKLWSSGWV